MLKKIIALLLLTVTLFLFGCTGEYQYGNTPTPKPGGGEGDSYVPPVMNDDPTDDFTVTLRANGEAYSPRMDMYAYWSNGFSVYTAKFDKDGVARTDGLDGDYRVTLSAIPNEYAYDPNSNVATNDDRNIVIDMYTINVLTGGGTGIYDCYNFSKTGVYSATIKSADDAIYFQYAPEKSGTYSIESWIDVTADNINPYVEVWGGSSQFKYYIKTTDDGGAVGSYTINFVHTVQIASENISAGGQAVYTFAVKADSKNGKYPITVTFAVKRDGEFELGGGQGGSRKPSNLVAPEFDFSNFSISDHEYGSDYHIAHPEYYLGSGNTYVFDQSRFKIYEKKDGGDGFYHLYDKEKYADTDGYGPILYAHITSVSRFIDRPFSKIEYNAAGETINGALTVNGKNYKHFIEGYSFLSYLGNINGGSYYCVAECPCHKNSPELAGYACPASYNSSGALVKCADCHNDCRPCPEDLYGKRGYAEYANSDGLVPVTEELKDFLYAYCMKEIFFYDGLGVFEDKTVDGKIFQSIGTSGWLFACAYYEKNQ